MDRQKTITTDDPIGFIGLGRMGHGMAINLQRAGFHIHGLSHAGNQPLDDVVRNGAEMHTTIGDLVHAVSVIIICVTGTKDVDAVMNGEDGILATAPHPLMIMDCSTGLPDDTRSRAALAEAKGHQFFDAAMTRTPKEAAEGRLNLIIGGDDRLRQRITAMLDPIAEVVTMYGQIGMGQEAKLIHNFVSLGFSAILAEAAARADHASLDRDLFLELIGHGGGGGVVFDRFRPYLEKGDKEAFNFTISNAVKDLSYFQDMSGEDSLNKAILSLFQDADQKDDSTVPELTDFISRRLKAD